MRLTKLEHAALVIEEFGKKLFVDPGAYTTALTDTAHAAAVVITHEHPDHWTPDQIQRVIDMSPDVSVFGPQGVADAAGDLPITVVRAGDVVEAGPFTLRFFGGTHALIHSSIPLIDNVGVLVNGRIYYAGDSYVVPEDVDVDVLAVPANAPWMKIAESMDYVTAVKPARSFPTHEMLLSKLGKESANARIQAATEAVGGQFFPLNPGDTLDV